MLPPIIAVSAPSRRSGKSTLSQVLMGEYGYTKFSFAEPLKIMFIALCMSAGVDKMLYPRILDGDLKETPLAEVGGLSLRMFAEGVGTVWGRDHVDSDLWVNMARPKIQKLLDSGKRVVVDDARFLNEVMLAYTLGGVAVEVRRPGAPAPTLASEGHLDGFQFTKVFQNDSSVGTLEDRVREWMGGR